MYAPNINHIFMKLKWAFSPQRVEMLDFLNGRPYATVSHALPQIVSEQQMITNFELSTTTSQSEDNAKCTA